MRASPCKYSRPGHVRSLAGSSALRLEACAVRATPFGIDRHSVRAERPLRHEAVVACRSAFRIEQPLPVRRSKVRGFGPQERTEGLITELGADAGRPLPCIETRDLSSPFRNAFLSGTPAEVGLSSCAFEIVRVF